MSNLRTKKPITPCILTKPSEQACTDEATIFFSALAHNLRQPLHAMGLFVGILERQNQQLSLDKQQALEKTLGPLSSTFSATERQVTSLLVFLQHGLAGAKPVIAAYSLNDLLQALFRMEQVRAEEYGVILHNELSQSHKTEIILQTDPDQLLIALSLLLNNAIRYGKSDVTFTTEPVNAQAIVLIIRDKGAGIPAAWQARLREPYASIEKTIRSEQSGLGLGLATVGLIARRLNIEISITNENPGTAIHLTLPISTP
jgi:signal transduction histidine kinase